MAPFFSWADGMLKWFSDWLRQRRTRSIPVAASQWAAAESEVPALHGLPPSDRERLRRLVLQFLADKEWTGAAGLELTPHMQLVIALQACLPILNLGLEWYDDWVGIVVYPDEFVIPRSIQDEDGIVHEYDELASGEAWGGGPVLVSWRDVRMAGDGYNVVIHEFVHKLDMRNGDADGIPPLPSRAAKQHWEDVLLAAYDDFCAEVDAADARDEDTEIDPYAAENPGEFFAVLAEAFFETPALVARRFPALYGQFASFFHFDPLA